MNITLYVNNSDRNEVSKNLTAVKVLSGTLREDCSIINPVFKIEGLTAVELRRINYCYIPDFDRYYFINNVVLKGKLTEIDCHVDVLMSFSGSIRQQKAVIARQQSLYDLYLQDGVFKTDSDPHYQIKQFPYGFSTQEFIFCVAG